MDFLVKHKVILIVHMDRIIKMVKSPEELGPLINGVSETLRYEMKKEVGFLGAMMTPIAASLIAPMASSLINAISGKEVIRVGLGQVGGFFPLIALPLMMRVLGKRVTRLGKRI